MIIFLYGPDTFRSRQKLKELKEKFIKEIDKSSLNLMTLDGATLDATEFEKSISTPPFLAKKRMVVIENLLSKNHGQKIQKEIIDLLERGSSDDTIIIFWEGELGDTNKKRKSKTGVKRSGLLLEKLKQEKYAQEFKLLDLAGVRTWAAMQIKNKNGKISSAALNLLADLVGNDLWQFDSELEKLIAYTKGQEISTKDVESLVKSKLDDDIFQLTDALGQKNKKAAVKLIANQFKSGVAPTELLSKVIWQYKNLLLLKSFVEKNGPGYPSQRLSYQLGLHPFVVKKTIGQVKNYELHTLKKIYRQLLKIDHKIKTSQADPEVLFDLLIVES